jgi:hypothetical protein
LRESLLSEVDIAPRSRLRLLLKSVQHVHGLGAPGHLDDAVSAAFVGHANLLNALADRRHWNACRP